MPDELTTRKDAMRAPWVTGDQGALSRTLGIKTAEDFVARLDRVEGRRVLDLACGSGTVSLPMARRDAEVTGLDLAPNLLAQARQAAEAEGLRISFDEGFAEELPYPDARFDLITSMFGVMFSPFPDRIAAEAARVLAPGGRIALANWTAEGLSGALPKVAATYLPKPVEPPTVFGWGEEAAMRSLLDPWFNAIETRRIPITWEMAGEPPAMADLFVKNAGPLQMLLGRLEAGQQATLIDDLTQLFADSNTAPPGSGRTRVMNEYLEIKATRRARDDG